MPRAMLHLLAAATFASLAFAACRPEPLPAEPAVPSRPTDPTNSRLAYLHTDDELDASIAPESGPILDASALPGYDVFPVAPGPRGTEP